MSDKPLVGKKIAILVADGFEQVELTGPREALDAAGADTSILSLKPGNVHAWKFTEWGEEFPVDMVVEHADPAAFDALLLPGGVINPDEPDGDGVRAAFLRREQAGRLDLSRSLVDRRGRGGARPAHDLVAVDPHRSAQRRRRGSR